MNHRLEQQADLCARIAELRPKLKEESKATISHADIIVALEQFRECVSYLNTRRSAGAIILLENEASVQDTIYLMLRPWIKDLVYENPTDKVGNRFVIKDFLSKQVRTVVEAKFIRDTTHGRGISKELHDDIEVYRHHPHCDHLIFFIYDPNTLIPDTEALRKEIVAHRVYDGRRLNCYLIVKP